VFTKSIHSAKFYYMDAFILLASASTFYLYKYYLDPSKSDLKRYVAHIQIYATLKRRCIYLKILRGKLYIIIIIALRSVNSTHYGSNVSREFHNSRFLVTSTIASR